MTSTAATDRGNACGVIAKFHYTGPTGPDQTKSADFVGDPGLRPGSREKVRADPRGSGRARVVEFSLNHAACGHPGKQCEEWD